MPSVTQRIKMIKQPRGGYINPKCFTVRETSGAPLHDIKENVNAGIVGMVVDYMTRAMSGTSVERRSAFHSSARTSSTGFPKQRSSHTASRASMTLPLRGLAVS